MGLLQFALHILFKTSLSKFFFAKSISPAVFLQPLSIGSLIDLILKPKSNAAVLLEDLDKLTKWEVSWKMEFHPQKCHVTLQLQKDLYMFGDFNTHFDLLSLNARSFISVLQLYVSFPTHVHGHWLDLFITRSTCIKIKAIFPTDGLSDHHYIISDLWLQIG